MKIIADTNIFVSAVMSPDGASREIIRLCLQGTVMPLMSNALAAEYEDVCGRRTLFKDAVVAEKVRDELLDAFFASCQWVSIYYLWRPNLRDEGDNHVVELAVGGGARTIVTSNKRDFTSSELLFPQLSIKTAAEFLNDRKAQ